MLLDLSNELSPEILLYSYFKIKLKAQNIQLDNENLKLIAKAFLSRYDGLLTEEIERQLDNRMKTTDWS